MTVRIDVRQLGADDFPELCAECDSALIDGDWVYQTADDVFCSPICAARFTETLRERKRNAYAEKYPHLPAPA